MKSTLVAVAVVGALFAAPAEAKDMTGRMGIGGESGGTGGVSFKYWAGTLGFQGLLAATITGGGAVAVNPTARLLVNILQSEDTNLYGGAGATLGIAAGSFVPTLELLVGVEHYFSDSFSVTGRIGLPLTIQGGGAGATVSLYGTGFGAGFTFYF